MSSASWSLQQAVFAALDADATLSALLGGGRIFDDVPQGTGLPYVTFAPATARDWSTSTDAGTEHTLVLHVWSSGHGRKDALAITAAIVAILHDRPLSLTGHRLINLRHEATEVRRQGDDHAIRSAVRFRAVTEPA